MKVVFKKSKSKNKKMTAVFYNKKNKKIKTTHFGQAGADDYTKKKDKNQRQRYIKRHTNARENHNNYKSAGSLSRNILWGNSTSKKTNIKKYKNKFNLK